MHKAPARAAACLIAGALSGAAATPAHAAPFFPPFGLDLPSMDKSVRPQDDFFQYVNGGWIARTAIPADKPGIDTFEEIADRTEARLHTLLEQQAAYTGDPLTPGQKSGAMYAAFMDEARIENLGAAPIQPELSAIKAAPDRASLATMMGRSLDDFGSTFFNVSIDIDQKDVGHYAVILNQGGLGLPDRDYYLKPEFAKQKAAYRAYVEQLLTLVKWPDAKAQAANIVAMETRIADASWTKAEQRDLPKLYNPETLPELATLAPGFPWKDFLRGAKLGNKTRVIVGEKTAFPKIAAIFADTPTDTLKAWLAFNVVDVASSNLSSPFQQAQFAFREKTLSGQPEMRARWKRAITLVSAAGCYSAPGDCFGNLTWAVGELYVAQYFPPATKAKGEKLVADLMHAFHTRLQNNAWMGPATKAEALKKLDTYTVKIGYPDHQRDYSHVLISRTDLIGDIRNAVVADWAFYVGRSDGPVDRTDWGMAPQIVNAYNGSLRDIVFPAAILQPPFFDPDADDAVNYGSIGAIIGHEMTHGFDDQGRNLDASGALRDWWTPADAAAFKARAAKLGAEFASFQPLPGLHINPDLTMGENIADLGGVVIALDAYHASLGGKPAPELDGLTGEQRFFLSWAQGWRIKERDDAIKQQIVRDPHSFDKFRAVGPLQNVDAWYAAFDVKPGDKMYRAPDLRAQIW
jgi:putative endopeptidase